MTSKSQLRRAAWLPLCAAAALAVPLVAAPRLSWAEDTEPAEPALPAGSISYSDSARVVKIALPKTFKADTKFEDPGKLGAWTGPLFPDETDNTAACTLTVNVRFKRARLAFTSSKDAGELVKESVREGDGFYESCHKGGRAPLLWRRYVEQGGRLYTVTFFSGHQDYAKTATAVHAYLDTFEVTGEPREDKLPDGWKEKSKKDFVLWSSLEDKKVIDEMIGLFSDVAGMLDKVLKGKPWDETPLKVKLYSSFNEFGAARDVDEGGIKENAVWVPKTDAVYVNNLLRNLKGFDEETYSAIADMRMARYFGGSVPQWLREALVRYTIYGMRDSEGKPEKATDQIVKMGQSAAKSAKALDHWFADASWSAADAQQGAEEVWAYVWYLQNGKAPKDARKAFENYISTLRETGDVNAAAKAWEGVDFAKLRSSFQSYAEKWK